MTVLSLPYNNAELHSVALPVLSMDQFGEVCCEMSLLLFVCMHLNRISHNEFDFLLIFFDFWEGE